MFRIQGYWYIATSASDLTRVPIRRSVEGEILVLFRDATGAPKALADHCAHRGMALSSGRVEGNCLRCPYHGWSYDGSGAVCEIPALGTDGPLPAAARVRSYPVAESDGHLWVWIGDQAPASGPFRFPHVGEDCWTTFFMQTRFGTTVELCLENFLDVPHTQFVHPGLFRGVDPRSTRVEVSRSRDGVVARFLDEAPLEGWAPRLLFPRGTSMKHSDRFILPSISRVDYCLGSGHGVVITSQCTQREEFLVDVTTAIAWNLPAPSWIVRPFLRWYCGRVIEQDVRLLEVQGRQVQQFGRSFVSSSADLLGRHIHALRRQAAEGHESPADLTEETVVRI